MARPSDHSGPIKPTPDEARAAAEMQRRMEPFLGSGRNFQMRVDGEGDSITLPEAVVKVLIRTLREMARGRAVDLAPVEDEMTTQEAANYLNVSRPYLIRLIDRGEIPCRKVGRYRRVPFQELARYKERDDAKRLAAYRELVGLGQELAQELGTEY